MISSASSTASRIAATTAIPSAMRPGVILTLTAWKPAATRSRASSAALLR